jgi:hypothetical protein
MDSITLSAEMQRKVLGFTDVYRAVMDEDADIETCLSVLLERGFEAALADILANQDKSILIRSIQHLAERDPEFVCRYVADMVGWGDDLRRRSNIAAAVARRNRS